MYSSIYLNQFFDFMFTRCCIMLFYVQLSKTGFPKIGQVAPLGAMTDIQGAMSSKGVKVVKDPHRAMRS